MKNVLLVISIILGVKLNAFCQSKSTIFIDSVLIIYHNDTLLNKDIKGVFYLTDNKNISLPVYRKDSFEVRFDFLYGYYYSGIINKFFRKPENVPEARRQYYIDPCGINVIDKKESTSFIYDSVKFIEKYCYLYNFQFIKTNWKNNTIAPKTINKIVVNLKITPSIPEDTINKITDERNGIWISTFFQDTIKIGFKNNLREGQAVYLKSNGTYSTDYFESNLKKGETKYFDKLGKEKGAPFVYPSHYVLSEECPLREKPKKSN